MNVMWSMTVSVVVEVVPVGTVPNFWKVKRYAPGFEGMVMNCHVYDEDFVCTAEEFQGMLAKAGVPPGGSVPRILQLIEGGGKGDGVPRAQLTVIQGGQKS